MKRMMMISSLALICISLFASVEVGALRLVEDNNFWRLVHYNGSSSGNGGYSASSGDYYYNSIYPAQPDSILSSYDDDMMNNNSKDVYLRQDFDDHYEISVTRYGYYYWENEHFLGRTLFHYNFQDQLTDEYLYYVDNMFVPSRHTQYDYNANGDVIAIVIRGIDEQILNYSTSTYDASNRLVLHDTYRIISGILAHDTQTRHFYSAWASPDSTRLWNYGSSDYDITLIQNSFDAFGNVILQTEYAPSKIKTTTSTYIYALDMYFPTMQTAITEQLSNGIWSPTDTFQSVYTYTNSYHTILQETYRNSEWFQSETLRYNDAWCLLQNQTNGYWYLPDGTYSSNANYTWEFFTTPNDDPVQTPVPALSAYPNPCRDNTTLAYLLKDSSVVTMNIYNIKGQKVLSQNLGTKSSGTHDLNITLDKNVFASGIYFVRLTTQHDTKNLKLIVIK